MSEHALVTLYGIPNCDQVRKTRAWLTSQSIEHVFHDIKKQPLTASLLGKWIVQTGWERLLNRQSATWRNVDPARRAMVTDAISAIALLQEFPSIMKRPVLEFAGHIDIGFDALRYQSLLSAQASA